MGFVHWILISVTTLLRVSTADTAVTVRNVTLLVLAPYGGGYEGQGEPGWKAGPAVVPAVRLAVDRINNRTDVLPGYHVQLLEENSGCEHSLGTMYKFATSVVLKRSSSNVVGVIGPGCSESTLLVGKLGARDGISLIQISPAATSPQLTDTVKYRNTFRMLSTALQHIGVVTQLMALNSWENVAVLYDNSRVFFRLQSEMLLAAQPSKIGFESAIDSTHYPLGSIEARYKVIILIAGGEMMKEVMCLAYHHTPKLVYPVYQWIMVDYSKHGLTSSIGFRHSGKFYNCTREIMKEALEGTILTYFQFTSQQQEDKLLLNDVDLTLEHYQELYQQYLREYLAELRQNDRDYSYEPDAEDYAVSYYDSTWALTLAINVSLEKISLTDYTFGQPHTTKIIRQQLGDLKFDGLMGNISFNSTTQDSNTPVNINQCIKGECNSIGVYDGTTLDLTSTEAKFVSEIFHNAVIGVNHAVAVIALATSILLAVYTACLHAIFIAFQRHQSIKAASFTLSHFMFSGCYLLLCQAFFTLAAFSYGWETKTAADIHNRDVSLGVICNINEWLNSIGMSLILSTLCVKLWRVYRIFSYFNTRSYLISDLSLTLFIVVVVTVNVVILVLWTTVDPLLATFEQQGIEYDGEDEPVLLVRVSCHCQYYNLWIAIIYSVLLLLLTSVVVLSSLNRRISRRNFRTAKSVNLMVYMITPTYFLGNGLAFKLQSLDIHYTYVLWQFSLLSIVCLVCGFMFTPPAYIAVRVSFLTPYTKR